MNNIKKGFLVQLILVLVIIFAGCKREEPAPEVKPLLKTNQVTVNTENEGSVIISAEFILPGTYRSIQYGFHLSTSSDFANPITIPAGSNNEPVRFDVTTNIGLKPDAKYYVRAWAKTEKYLVFGNSVEFQSIGSSAPVINKIYPAKGIFGDTIKIIGKNFDFFGKENKVFFKEVPAAKIWCKQDTIWAIVPVMNLSQDLNMTINVGVFLKRTLIGQSFAIAAPVISGISISQGQFPDSVKVTGDNFFTDYTTLLVDGVATKMLDVTRKSFSFVVPYLKQDRTVKIGLNSLNNLYSITDNFHYLGQSILECSPNLAWIGDTLKLYAKNTDFRRIQLSLKNFDTDLWVNDPILKITHTWKDSVAFILSGNYTSSKFTIDVQFGEMTLEWPYTNYTTVDQKIVNHRSPLLESIEKTEYVYNEPINYKAKGENWAAVVQVLLKSMDGSVNLSLPSVGNILSNQLFPGDYQMQLSSYGRLSDIKLFTIKAPSIETVSPSEISSNDRMLITGKNLPYSSVFKFTHIESGRSFMLGDISKQSVDPGSKQVAVEDIVGSGNYQIELSIGDKSYKYPGIIKVKNNFSYISKMADPFWQFSISCGFAISNKLYTRQNGQTSIIDISNGKVQISADNTYGESQPVFFNDKVYLMVAKDGKNVIGSFNVSSQDWDALNMEGIATGHELSCFGVCNNHLIAISTNGDIYQYNLKWNFLNNVKTNHYFLNYIYSANGKLYLCDFYMGKISVVSTSDWKIIDEISMPGTYENSLRYIFEIQGKMYFCAKPGGGVEDQFNLYRFNSDETFEALSPGKLKWDYYYQFCPDGKGNVYFVNERYIYNFKPLNP